MIVVPNEPAITDYLYRKAALKDIPLSGSFELTPVCNMNCNMCYVRMSKEKQESIHRLYTADEWIELARQAKEAGMLYLLLTGGEPFLRSDFKIILKALHEMGFIISINSNATLIDEKVIEWLKEYPPMRINITLYGASNETYDRLCHNPKGFDQVTKAIELLQEAGIIVKLNCSVTPDNVGDLEQMIQFAFDHQLIIQASSYMFPPLRKDPAKVGQNERFTPEKAAYYQAKIEALMSQKEIFLEKAKEAKIALPSDLNEDCLDDTGEGMRCRAGRCSFWVTWDGHLIPCGMMPSFEGINVFEQPFIDGWKYANQYTKGIILPAKCRSCELKNQCRSCAAMVYTETGDFTKIPQYRCDMAHHYPFALKQVAKEIGGNNE